MNARIRSFLWCAVAAMAAVVAMPSAHANPFYWDSNGTTAGLGDTGGLTWGTSANIASLAGGNNRTVVLGTFSVANTATTTAQTIYFGTTNLGLGATASNVAVGTRSINTIVFGQGQSDGVTLSGGTITLPASGGGVIANNTAPNTISSVFQSATTNFTKGGAGTVILTGANTYTGTTIVSGGGTLTIGNGTTGSLNGTTGTALTFNNGGGIFNGAEAVGSTQGMGTLTFTAGDGTVQSTYAGSGTTTLTFGSLAARAAGATGNFLVSGGANGSTNSIVLTGASTGTLLDRGLYFGGSSYAAYDAGGFVRAYGSGDTGYLAAPAGATMGSASTDNVELTTGDITAQDTASANTINMGANSITMTGTSQVLSTNGILSSGSATIGGGTTPQLTTVTGSADLVVRVSGGSDVLTISSDIVNNGTTPLTKSGAGTLALSGANTYTGTTQINAGTLALSGGSAIANAGAVVLANAAGATLRLDADETIGNVSGGGLSGGNVNVQGNTLTLSSNAGYAFGGTFSGTAGGGVIKQGSGTLTLSAQNSFAGSTSVSGGSLTFSFGNTGAASQLSISSGGAINLANGTFLNLLPVANFSAGVIGNQITPATASNTGGFTFGNAINLTGAAATIRAGQNDTRFIFSGNVTGDSTGASTLAVNFGSTGGTTQGDRTNLNFTGVMADGSGGAMGLNIALSPSNAPNPIFVNLIGQNTFTGPITVTTTGTAAGNSYFVVGGESFSTGGSVRTNAVAGTGYLGSGNYTSTIALTNAGVVLNYLSSANQILGGDISGAGSILKEGSGTLTFSGNNTYTGTTTVSAGTLLVNGDQTLATGVVTVSNAGSTLGGSGIIGGNTTLNTGTILTPGTSPGTLTFNQDLTLIGGAGPAGATAIFEGGDLVNVNGILTLNTDWNLTLTSGFQDGGTVTLFNYVTAGATLDLDPDYDISGLGFTPSGSLTLTDTGSSIVLNGISIVPEPGTWAMLGAGAALIGLRFARRRS